MEDCGRAYDGSRWQVRIPQHFIRLSRVSRQHYGHSFGLSLLASIVDNTILAVPASQPSTILDPFKFMLMVFKESRLARDLAAPAPGN